MMAWLWALAWAGPCEEGTTTRFACEVAGGKVAALCQGPQGLAYRFGPPEQAELRVPSSGWSTTVTASQRTTGPDAATTVFSVVNDGHRYALVVDRTEDQHEGRVVVRKGSKALATLACVGPVTADTTELPTAPRSPDDWVGTWDGPTGQLRIDGSAEGLVLTEGTAVWHGGGGRVHDGRVTGPLQGKGDSYQVTQEACELSLTMAGPDLLEVDDNLRCGGLNVTFGGTYHRLP
jgi:hypothetical protein